MAKFSKTDRKKSSAKVAFEGRVGMAVTSRAKLRYPVKFFEDGRFTGEYFDLNGKHFQDTSRSLIIIGFHKPI